MIKVLFFAQVRELVNTDSLTLDASFERRAGSPWYVPPQAAAISFKLIFFMMSILPPLIF